MDSTNLHTSASMRTSSHARPSRIDAAPVMSPSTAVSTRHVDSITRREATVLFADICGYTTLMELDELEGHVVTTSTLERIEYAAFESGGVVREHAGDRLLIEFAAPQTAVSLAFKITKEKLSWPALAPFAIDQIRLRIGIHRGKVLDLGPEIRGTVVIMAARVQELAKPGGVAITQEVLSYFDTDYQIQFQFRSCTPLKNILEPVSIYDGPVNGPW